jgi:di/tricarboxylate transporter
MSTVLLILRRCALRHWRLALRQQIALMLILALGSSVYLAVRLASNAALSGFETFTDGITRQPDWTVQAVSGILRESDVREMREALGHRPVSLLPVVESWCQRRRISPSKVLLPLSFATVLGGTMTLLGSSVNLLASEVSNKLGYGAFGLFSVTPIGIGVWLVGGLVMVLVARAQQACLVLKVPQE